MAEIKQFVTAAQAAVADEEDDGRISFKVDDLEVTAWPPSPGQFAMAYTLTSDRHPDGHKVAALIDFFFGLLDKNAQQVLAARLMDRNDPWELEQLTEILEWLMGEWTARPTSASSGSAPSQKPTGRKSTATARRTASTRSASRSLVSAT